MSTSEPARPSEASAVTRAALDQTFDRANLVALRSAVSAHATALGLPDDRCDDLVLLAHELASNAVAHGGGSGRLRLWATDDHVYCEVSDQGGGPAPKFPAGREQPPLGATGGRGLWLVRSLADGFHLTSGVGGATVTVSLTLTRPSLGMA